MYLRSQLVALVASLLLLTSTTYGALVQDLQLPSSICPEADAKVLSTTYIGKDRNVKVSTLSCSPSSEWLPRRRQNELVERQSPVNVCGATCNTNCFLPAGGGPDPNDCHIIADALRYDSQNIGALFVIPNGNSTSNPVRMQFSSCLTFFVNQDPVSLQYCRTNWASLIDFIAPNCQATQNAHGGNCIASDQRWFVQVQHS